MMNTPDEQQNEELFNSAPVRELLSISLQKPPSESDIQRFANVARRIVVAVDDEIRANALDDAELLAAAIEILITSRADHALRRTNLDEMRSWLVWDAGPAQLNVAWLGGLPAARVGAPLRGLCDEFQIGLALHRRPSKDEVIAAAAKFHEAWGISIPMRDEGSSLRTSIWLADGWPGLPVTRPTPHGPEHDRLFPSRVAILFQEVLNDPGAIIPIPTLADLEAWLTRPNSDASVRLAALQLMGRFHHGVE